MKCLPPILLLLLTLALSGCSSKTPDSSPGTTPKLRVGVFDGHGGAQTCVWEAYEAIRLDTGLTVRYVTSSDLASGILDELEVLVIPGGGGSRQYLNMGGENHKRIQAFASNGGGIVGICAGAYLLSNTPGYACLHMSGGKAIDIEHDNRGHGLAKVTLTELGKTVFPELTAHDTLYIVYYEGPVYDTLSEAMQYHTLATMMSDVHTEGNAPSNMTIHRPFLIGSAYGKGRLLSCIAHPEATPGMQWMIPRMARWAANAPLTPYSDEVVMPSLYGREILFTEERLQKEKACYTTFLYGSEEEKVASLDWLEAHASWDAKRWVQGLLYDASPAVRRRAAEYVGNAGFTHYLADVEAAYQRESDPSARETMQNTLARLKRRVHME